MKKWIALSMAAFAYLHFEMREFITLFVGPGYREDTSGWLNPSAFIQAHCGTPDDDCGPNANSLSKSARFDDSDAAHGSAAPSGNAKTFCGSAATFGRSQGPLNSRLEIPPVRQQVNPIEREQSNR